MPKLTVHTRHSKYEIDEEAKTFVRTRVHPLATDFTRYNLPDTYDDIYLPEPASGEGMVIYSTNGLSIRTTSVERIQHPDEILDD